MSNYSPVSILFTTDGDELASKTAATTTLTSRGFISVGVDAGGTARFVRVDGAGQLVMVGQGVAGTPAGGVVSVQGVAGGQALPISGTATANQGTAGTHAQRWMMGLSDGTSFITPATDRTTAAQPFSVRLSDGTAFYDGAKTGQLPASLVGGRLDANVGAWLGSTAPTVGQKVKASSVPVTLPSDQTLGVYPSYPDNTPTPRSFSPIWGLVATAAVTTVAVRYTTYTEQTTNGQRSFASASANDTAAGTGARQLRLVYFDQNMAGPFEETVTLNGTTRVVTVATNICFIEDIEITSVGSGGSNAGIISLFTLPAAGVAFATIAAGANRTQWVHHYVAADRTCYVTGLSANNNSTAIGNGTIFSLRRREGLPAAGAPEQIVDQNRSYGQSSGFFRVLSPPLRVVGPARLTVYATPESATAVTQRASMDFYEVLS